MTTDPAIRYEAVEPVYLAPALTRRWRQGASGNPDGKLSPEERELLMSVTKSKLLANSRSVKRRDRDDRDQDQRPRFDAERKENQVSAEDIFGPASYDVRLEVTKATRKLRVGKRTHDERRALIASEVLDAMPPEKYREVIADLLPLEVARQERTLRQKPNALDIMERANQKARRARESAPR